MRQIILIALGILCFTFFPMLEAGTQHKIEDYPDILNIKNIPAQSKDWKSFCFSDQGAWFGFALPPESASSHYGSFPGPFDMTCGRWLSDRPAQLFLQHPGSKKRVEFAAASRKSITYYPGRLVQQFRVGEMEIVMRLIFVSNKSALITTTIRNLSKKEITYRYGWDGQLLDLPLNLNAVNGIISIENQKTSHSFFIKPGMATKAIVSNKTHYSLEAVEPLNIKPGEQETLDLVLSFSMGDKEGDKKGDRLENEEQKNTARWTGYLNKALNTASPFSADKSYRNIAVKSVMTLINNWRCAYGDLQFDGLFPSYAVSYFNGFWAWDSWKHAVALARFAPEIAINQIRTMFALQDKYGMVPDVIYADKKENNWRDTKPPLAAWAVWELFTYSKDKKFIKEIYQKLLKYHRWWYENRDHDHNGLCEYGSTDGTLVAALWESGMDDAVRFDKRKMVKNNPRAWSIDIESVDLNSYLYADKLYIAKMAQLLGQDATASQLKKEAETLKKKIQIMMFNPKTGFFHDIDLHNKSFHTAQGPEGWIPLWANVAAPHQARQVKDVICNPNKFSTHIPFPTVSKDNPRFNTGYWRGAVWLDQAYFGVKALRNYGYHTLADNFTRQLFDRPRGLKDSTLPIRENYDPVTGKGLKVNHFSWSAAHYLLLFRGE